MISSCVSKSRQKYKPTHTGPFLVVLKRKVLCVFGTVSAPGMFDKCLNVFTASCILGTITVATYGVNGKSKCV